MDQNTSSLTTKKLYYGLGKISKSSGILWTNTFAYIQWVIINDNTIYFHAQLSSSISLLNNIFALYINDNICSIHKIPAIFISNNLHTIDINDNTCSILATITPGYVDLFFPLVGVEEDSPFLFLILGVFPKVGVSCVLFVWGCLKVIGWVSCRIFSSLSLVLWVGDATWDLEGISLSDIAESSTLSRTTSYSRMVLIWLQFRKLSQEACGN